MEGPQECDPRGSYLNRHKRAGAECIRSILDGIATVELLHKQTFSDSDLRELLSLRKDLATLITQQRFSMIQKSRRFFNEHSMNIPISVGAYWRKCSKNGKRDFIYIDSAWAPPVTPNTHLKWQNYFMPTTQSSIISPKLQNGHSPLDNS
ncbi:Hypothetical predicted protein [Pelobates cultripes]|uniref:Uncharacterized protein n=1 Tax=Pelobates cultripes TaxID=61616 RepID=A0AAD1RXY0_PELCU|nr:Hypothetical predicted protein [Pelobates cultripes]